MENSEVKGGTKDGDKKQTVGVEKPMKDEWKFDNLEENDMEELANDEKVCNTEDYKNTNRNTGGKDDENGEEIKPSNGQEKPKRQEMDEGQVVSEVAMKEIR